MKIISNNQSLLTVFPLREKALSKSINCLKLGKIENFDATTQTADVEIIDKIFQDDKTLEYSALQGCPVFVLSSGSASIQMPIKKRDDCFIFFADSDTNTWYESGIAPIQESQHSHHLTDAFVLVGIKPPSQAIKNYIQDGIVIESDVIKLGSGLATKGVARVGDTITITPEQWMAANPQTSQGPVTLTAPLQFTITSGSTKVKAE